MTQRQSQKAVLSSLGAAAMLSILTNLYKDQSGAAALEYGLLIALLSGVIIAVVRATGTSISTMFNILF